MLYRTATLAIFFVALINMAAPKTKAAIVGFTDFAAFQAAASGDFTTVDFEATTGNVTNVDGVTFSVDSGGLGIRSVDAGGGDINNVVGTSNVLFSELENETVTVDFGGPRSAAGLFIVFEGTDNATTNAGVTLTGGGVTENLSGANAFATFTGNPIFDTPNSTFFIGLVDDTGANSLSTIDLSQSGTSTGFFFDDVTAATATAVPEPSSFTLAALAVAGSAIGRRRMKRKTTVADRSIGRLHLSLPWIRVLVDDTDDD